MFIPEMFRMTDAAAIARVIDDYGFGYLVTAPGANGFPEISAVPMMLVDNVLYGHLARANPHWKLFDGAHPTRALFQGPHAYVSPTWYPDPARSVPTWNYVLAVVEGRPREIEDVKLVDWILSETARRYEGADGWSLEKTQAGYIDGMKRGIVAFQMPVDGLYGKAKLSQNKPDELRSEIAKRFRETGQIDLAEAMRLPDEDQSSG